MKTCKVCRCTDATPCVTVKARAEVRGEDVVLHGAKSSTFRACSWVEDDLCSSCTNVTVIEDFELQSVSIDSTTGYGGRIERITFAIPAASPGEVWYVDTGERLYLPYPGGDPVGGKAAAMRIVDANPGYKAVPMTLSRKE